MQQHNSHTTGTRIFRKAAWVSGLALLMGVWLGEAPSAHAVLVEYQIQNGTQGNFGFSDLHDAASGVVDVGTTRYWASGAILSNGFSGSLFGDQQIVGTTVTLTGINGTVNGSSGLTLSFTGGTLTGDTAASFTASGFMNVNLSGPVSRTETFYFHPVAFTSPAPGANTFDGLLFGLWGNNWNNGVDPTPAKANEGTFTSSRLGIDLKGTIVSQPAPVPLPAAGVLFGTGLIGLLGAAKKRFTVKGV